MIGQAHYNKKAGLNHHTQQEKDHEEAGKVKIEKKTRGDSSKYSPHINPHPWP